MKKLFSLCQTHGFAVRFSWEIIAFRVATNEFFALLCSWIKVPSFDLVVAVKRILAQIQTTVCVRNFRFQHCPKPVPFFNVCISAFFLTESFPTKVITGCYTTHESFAFSSHCIEMPSPPFVFAIDSSHWKRLWTQIAITSGGPPLVRFVFLKILWNFWPIFKIIILPMCLNSVYIFWK